MRIGVVDVLVIIAVLSVTLLLGVAFTRRGSANVDAYFVSGRSLTWYIAGGSMIATSFASDTPLWVTNLVRQHGIHYIWQFWAPFIGAVLAVVYFGRRWRRMGFVTDLELIETRYSGGLAPILRVFSGATAALFFCPLIAAWVIKAMETISREALGLPEESRLAVTAVVVLIAVLVSACSGLLGVVYSDFFQLVLATVGTLILAILAVVEVGGLVAMREQLVNMSDWAGTSLNILPEIGSKEGQMSIWNAVGFFGILWLTTGLSGGYQAQRLLACRDSHTASYAQLFFTVVYYALMAWPWVVIALCSIILFPDLTAPDQAAAYPRMIVEILPAGLRGLLIAALFAAFVSTISTLFNWGSSYVINDLYRRFIHPEAKERTYILMARIITVIIATAGAVISFYAENIQQLLAIAYVIGSGTAIILLLRWLWWRMNSYGDMAAQIGGWLVSALLLFAGAFDPLMGWLMNLPPEQKFSTCHDLMGARMLFVMITVALIAIVVSIATAREKESVLRSFLLKARPFALGWRPVVKLLDTPYDPIEGLGRTLLSWLIGVVCIFSLLYGVGQFLIGTAMLGFICMIVFLVLLSLTAIRIKQDENKDSLIRTQENNNINKNTYAKQ